MEKISQYCQKCRAANEPGEANCWRCGTRLMLVVIPPSVRHEESLVPSYYEDHLLERVSLLELRLGQIAERLSMALDLMLRQTKTAQNDHFLLETIVESVNALGISDKETLAKKLRERLEPKTLNEIGETRPKDRIFKEIILAHDNSNTDLFANLVKEGIKFLDGGEEKQGFRTLERAAQISPRNVVLLTFLAEKLFRADKFESAKKHLENAFEIAPQDAKILLLLGIICADSGETENARRYLSVLTNNAETVFCVNYIWGFLAARDENWTETLGAFKAVLAAKNAPETQYLTACAYFQLKRRKTARKHLQKAIEQDENYADAWFMLGVINNLENDEIAAEQAFARVWEAKDASAQSLELLKRKKISDLPTALPFLRVRQAERNLLTGNARRLSRFFREEVYKLL